MLRDNISAAFEIDHRPLAPQFRNRPQEARRSKIETRWPCPRLSVSARCSVPTDRRLPSIARGLTCQANLGEACSAVRPSLKRRRPLNRRSLKVLASMQCSLSARRGCAGVVRRIAATAAL